MIRETALLKKYRAVLTKRRGYDMKEKYDDLKEYIKSLRSVAVAFSGGVDSTFLLKTAHDVLGDNCVAITARSCSFPQRELNEAKAFCENEGIKHIIIESEELSIDGFAQNPKNRCYLCKTELFTKMRKAAAELGIENIAEGSNIDDNGDYRPGLIAVKEQNIKSPLRHAGLTKNEIRELSKNLGLDTWDKQSFACLSSRFVYGETITEEKLGMVDKAEQYLLDLGFTQVRVRVHGDMARIEINKNEFPKILEKSDSVYDYLKSLGFTYVSLDLGGYRTGSMNETLEK